MPYNKSTQKDYGENPMKKRSGFKMRSGNSTPFKELGSSPVKGKRQLKRDAATTKLVISKQQ
mgnify:CR=1 FL=1